MRETSILSIDSIKLFFSGFDAREGVRKVLGISRDEIDLSLKLQE